MFKKQVALHGHIKTMVEAQPLFAAACAVTGSIWNFLLNRRVGFQCVAFAAAPSSQQCSPEHTGASARLHHTAGTRRERCGWIQSSATAHGIFTYCRAWRASSPRSITTTETIWRNSSAGRHLGPWSRRSTAYSCRSCFTVRWQIVPNRAPHGPVRDTHPHSYSVLCSVKYEGLVHRPQWHRHNPRSAHLGDTQKSAARTESA